MPDYSKLTPESLKKLIRVVERRAKLVENLKEIDAQIDEILKKETAGVSSAPSSLPVKEVKRGRRTKTAKAAQTTKDSKAAKPAKTSRKREGNRADGITKILRAAGAEGERVIDIAKKLGSSPQNLHVWFGQTGKRLGLFKKLEPGRYALKEFLSSKSASSAPASTPAPTPAATPTPAPQQPSPYSYQPQSHSPQNEG